MERLKEIYEDPSQPGSFGGVDSLYKEARRRGLNVTKNNVKRWLSERLSYSLHRPARKKIKRNKTTAFYIDEHWQMDLCDMRAIKQYNDNMTFLLTVIDIFSKMAFVKAVLDKRGPTILRAFTEILEENNRKPTNLQSDMGVEFTNKNFKRAMQQENINYFVTYSEIKAGTVERFNRSLKSRMWKYFTHANTFRYVDVLQKLVDGYNTSRHRGINGRTPKSINETNQLRVWRESYAPKPCRRVKFKFKTGDKVRISISKGVFEKGYVNSWSEEYFIVYRRLARSPPVYTLRDLNNEVLKGVFYEEQLQLIHPGEIYPISEVLQKRGRRALVSWRGWPSPAFDSWIPLADIQLI